MWPDLKDQLFRWSSSVDEGREKVKVVRVGEPSSVCRRVLLVIQVVAVRLEAGCIMLT